MTVATFTKTGNKATTATSLDQKIFGLSVADHQLLKDVYLSYLAEARSSGAKTKKRGEVRGGGRKPWRQKGTGNARFGSSRNPIWRSGGVAFGPTGNENHSLKLNTKARRLALRQALSLAANEDRVLVIDSVEANGKTKDTAKLFAKVGAEGNVLVVVEKKDEKLIKSTRNLPGLVVSRANYLNVYNVLNADKLVVTSASLKLISDWLAPQPVRSREK